MFLAATLWALLAIVGGFLYFWRGEGRYGRG
jgi:teichoic acid transport system permease protein